MKTTNYQYLLAALLAGPLAFSNAWADRILINDINQTVTLSRVLDCYSTPDIRIDTSKSEIFGPQSKKLQAVTDTVRVMLGYECPGLSQINITGTLRGLEDVVYRGELLAQNNWLVQSLNPASAGYREYEEQNDRREKPWETTPISNRLRNGALSIINLELGMGIEKVSKIVSDTFYVEPQYDAGSGLMTMQAGGCPANFNIERDANSASPDWKCLKAWFSDNRIPRLDRLELVQVVNKDTSSVQQQLVEKYGYPDASEITPIKNEASYRWHENNDTNYRSIQLRAVLSETGTNRVITSLVLSNQQEDDDRLVSFSDVDLKL